MIKQYSYLIWFWSLFICKLTAGTQLPAVEKEMQCAKSPSLRLIENKGQIKDMKGKPVPSILFKVDVGGMQLYITEKGLTYVLLKKKTTPPNSKAFSVPDTTKTELEWTRVEMNLENAVIQRSNIVKSGASLEDFNFYFPHCPDGILGVKEYEKILIKDVYPNIDWILYCSKDNGFKYDFVVHPGANPKNIKLVYLSSESIELSKNGDLVISTSLGDINEKAPYSYIKETGRVITSKYQIEARKKYADHYQTSVSFFLETTDNIKNSTIIIDPQLFWGTLYSGSLDNIVNDVTTDDHNNIFVTGATNSVDFPLQDAGNFYQGTIISDGINIYDVFILKFDKNGQRLWATFYGGSELDWGSSITTFNNNDIVIIGNTKSYNFPVLNTGTYFQQGIPSTGAIDLDIFILKFTNSGVRKWATYYGGPYVDYGNAVTTDQNNNIFITGHTWSHNFPLQNAGTFFQGSVLSGSTSEAYILKFDSIGNRLWATFYGDIGNDMGNSITVDISGNIFVTGETDSPNFPLQNAGSFFQNTLQGKKETFLLKFDNNGNRLWATFYGGSKDDRGCTIGTDINGNIFITGNTESSDFPLKDAGTFFDDTLRSDSIVFVSKFDNSGNYLWGTYYCGYRGDEYALAPDLESNTLAIDPCGNVYICFQTNLWGPLFYQDCDEGYYDVDKSFGQNNLVVKFSNSGNLEWASFFGDSYHDVRAAIATDHEGSLILGGTRFKNSKPIDSTAYVFKNPGNAYFDTTYRALNMTALIAKFTHNSLVNNISVVNNDCGCKANASVVLNGNCASTYSYKWSNGQTTSTVNNLCSGTYTLTVTAQSTCLTHSQSVLVNIKSVPSNIKILTNSVGTPCNATTGSATASATGGAPPYNYYWTPGGQTNQTATNLSAGIYTVTVTDNNNCTQTQTINITFINVPKTTITITNNISCYGMADGTAIASSQDGISPYWYIWSSTGQSGQTAHNLSAGTYTVTTGDAGGCSVENTITITQPDSIKIMPSTYVMGVLCNGDKGIIDFTTTGGTPPYIYNWTPGKSTLQPHIEESAGNYTVVVTDQAACSNTLVVGIAEPPSLSFSKTRKNLLCGGDHNGTAEISAFGGVPPYTYLWMPVGKTDKNVTGLESAIYTITLQDSNNCKVQDTLQIHFKFPQPTLKVNKDTIILLGQTAPLHASGGSSYTWVPPDGLDCSSCADPLAMPQQNVTYIVTTTDTNGCTATAAIHINVNTTNVLFIPDIFSPDGDGQNDVLYVRGLFIKELSFIIYDRWGEKVFESNNLNNGWDGTFRGKNANEGVYVYYIKTVFQDNKKLEQKGNITLIR